MEASLSEQLNGRPQQALGIAARRSVIGERNWGDGIGQGVRFSDGRVGSIRRSRSHEDYAIKQALANGPLGAWNLT
jgi:hypothetical protein